tara:strand:- start:701 stop:1018 length:318 start_codon:yes stop_codon:yes gene_type:complete
MTEGDKRWIENWKPKGVKMKPTKTKPSKRNANLTNGNPIIGKLLKLKYKINDAYRNTTDKDTDTRADKSWVMTLISDVRENDLTKLSPEDGLKCNGLWRKYEQVL